MEEGIAAAEQFLAAATQLILRSKPAHKCTETELLGWRLAIRLQVAFQLVPDDSYIPILREALAAFDREPSREKTRAWCVRAIAEWGERWHEPEWQETERTRNRAISQLVQELILHDEAFEGLKDDHDALSAKLDVWTPVGARGKKTSERILAELIVEDCDALGLKPKRGESEVDAIERIRKVLVRDFDSFRARSSSSKTA